MSLYEIADIAEISRLAKIKTARDRQYSSLRQKISQLEDAEIRNSLLEELSSGHSKLQADSDGKRWTKASAVESFYMPLKAKLKQAEINAEMNAAQETFMRENISSQMDDMQNLLTSASMTGFTSRYERLWQEINASDRGNQRTRIDTLSKIQRDLKLLFEEAEYASTIDVSGLKEERTVIKISEESKKESREKKIAQLRDDIGQYFFKIRYLNENEAKSLEIFYEEAMQCDVEMRLDNIKSKIKLDYARIAEQATLTSLFREELGTYVPVLRGIPSASLLLGELETSLKRDDQSRDLYTSLYTRIKDAIYLASQQDIVTEITSTTHEVLSSLGYTLVNDDEPNPPLLPGKIRYLETPQPDYRVALNITPNAKMMVRLVRVVGDESAKQSQSVYQKQKDREAAKSWCKSLKLVEEELQAHGFQLNMEQRVEPDDEGWELPIIVDSKVGARMEKKQRRSAPQERFMQS